MECYCASNPVECFMQGLVKRHPGESDFHQAVHEVVETFIRYVLEHPEYQKAQMLERMTEPDQVNGGTSS